jgi:hypothetical protein
MGSQSGLGRGGNPKSFRRSEGRPESIATTRKPVAMAKRLPRSQPRFFVSAPNRNTPRREPYVYPNIPKTIGRILDEGFEMTIQAVAAPIRTRMPEKATVLHRAARREFGLLNRGARKGSYQSRTQEVARALSAVLREHIVVAKIPAMRRPRRPGGSSSRM